MLKLILLPSFIAITTLIIVNYLVIVKSLFVIIILSFTSSVLGSYKNIGELFVVPVCPTHGKQHIDEVANLLKKRGIGSIIFMEGTRKMQLELLQRFESELDRPLLVFQDGDWGLGMRLYDVSSLPRNLTLGAIRDLSLLKAYGLEVARQCREVGVDSPLGPVVDVNSNPLNPVIGTRSYGDDPYEVARRALAVIEGMHEGGIRPCIKHFPGHGDTSIDSHHALPVVEKSLSELEELELIPFQAAIDAKVDMVMLGHLSIPSLSPLPSSLSPEIVRGLLKKEMGFKGLVITDALNMHALSNYFEIEDVAEKAFIAGVDLMLLAEWRPDVIAYLIRDAIPKMIDHLEDTVPEELIEKRASRVLKFKEKKKGALPPPNPGLRRTLYRHALTAFGSFRLSPDQPLSLIQNGTDPDFEECLRRYVEVRSFRFDEIGSAPKPHLISLRKGDTLPFIPEEAIIAHFDSPYTLPAHPNLLVAYEDVPEMKEAVSDALFTAFTPSGKLPIGVFEEYERESLPGETQVRCSLAREPQLQGI